MPVLYRAATHLLDCKIEFVCLETFAQALAIPPTLFCVVQVVQLAANNGLLMSYMFSFCTHIVH